jgi:hypothetical protein
MVGARITCASCHQSEQVTDDGTVLWAASTKTCAHCHDNTAIDKLWSIHESLRTALVNMDACLSRLRDQLRVADLDDELTATFSKQMDEIDSDLKFLRVANGIHNIHYAGTLTRALVQRLRELCREFDVAPPDVTLPDASEMQVGDRS